MLNEILTTYVTQTPKCMCKLFFRKREINKKKAAQLLREGKRAEARECLQRCIDISPDMALNLMTVSTNLYMLWLI